MATVTVTAAGEKATATYTPPGVASFTHGSQMQAALAAGQIGLKRDVVRVTVAPFAAQAGKTYSNLTITGTMNITVPCTFINCQFLGTDGLRCVSTFGYKGATRVRFEYCQFDGQNKTDRCLDGY